MMQLEYQTNKEIKTDVSPWVCTSTPVIRKKHTALISLERPTAPAFVVYHESRDAVTTEPKSHVDVKFLAPGWLEDANQLLSEDEHRAIDVIFRTFNKWLHLGLFEKCDHALVAVHPERIDPQLALSMLTVTLPVRDKLRYRLAFLENFRKVLVEAGEEPEEILRGL